MKIDISKLQNNNENCLKADSKVILKEILIKFGKLAVCIFAVKINSDLGEHH